MLTYYAGVTVEVALCPKIATEIQRLSLHRYTNMISVGVSFILSNEAFSTSNAEDINKSLWRSSTLGKRCQFATISKSTFLA